MQTFHEWDDELQKIVYSFVCVLTQSKNYMHITHFLDEKSITIGQIDVDGERAISNALEHKNCIISFVVDVFAVGR